MFIYQVMTKEEKETITDLRKCDFRKMHAYFMAESEARKNRTKEEKLVKWNICVLDLHILCDMGAIKSEYVTCWCGWYNILR